MSDAFRGLRLYNTLTRSKEDFVPIDPGNVRMYVCGPTVYDYAHIGNARPAIVFDVLYRLLRHLYGEDHVTYVRNITDVDDKINARALRDHGAGIASGALSLNEAIRKVTEPTYEQYQKDVTALGCLPPTHQPRATEHIDGMIAMAQQLLDRGHAYLAVGGEGREVLFDVASMPAYGRLSNRRLEDQQAGARIEVKDHKRNPGDFVLWKESSASEPGWPAHFHASGAHADIFGRPGWHLECSVMSEAYLGRQFDIHGGGLDLIFPHHENEIAQSCCAHGTERMANIWMHNGFLQVEGRKMSKSDGNFVTIRESLQSELGDTIRWLMLKTHYRQPIDFTHLGLLQASRELSSLCGKAFVISSEKERYDRPLDEIFLNALLDDIDIAKSLARLHQLADSDDRGDRVALRAALEFLGVKYIDQPMIFNKSVAFWGDVPNQVAHLAIRWKSAFANELSEDAAIIEIEAAKYGWNFILENGSVQFIRIGEAKSDIESKALEAIDRRLAFIREKNWPEADRIRDELLAQGIQLKDGKDPVTGERVTTWEVKR